MKPITLMRYRAAPGGGSVVTSDDFSSNTIGSYTEYANSAANWAIAGGYLSATSGAQSVLTRNGVLFAGGEVQGVITEAQDTGLVLRLVDAGNYYLAVIYDNLASDSPRRNTVTLYKRAGGIFTQLAANVAIPTFTRGTPQVLAFSASGTNLIVKVNGTTYITVSDNSLTSAGRCGVRMNAAGAHKFDSFKWG